MREGTYKISENIIIMNYETERKYYNERGYFLNEIIEEKQENNLEPRDLYYVENRLQYSTSHGYIMLEKEESILEDEPIIDMKPIIYLYPQETTEITVKLGNPEKITCSYPKILDSKQKKK